MFKKKVHGRFFFCPLDFFGPSLVVWDNLTILDKLYRVSLKDTSFRKFNLNFFYKKYFRF